MLLELGGVSMDYLRLEQDYKGVIYLGETVGDNIVQYSPSQSITVHHSPSQTITLYHSPS
jgi:hypothetical protein